MFDMIDQILAEALGVDVDEYTEVIESMIDEKGYTEANKVIKPLMLSEDDEEIDEALRLFYEYKQEYDEINS